MDKRNEKRKTYKLYVRQIFLNEFVKSIPYSETKNSLAKLLKSHMVKIQRDYDFLSFEEKASIVTETLNNRALKQHLDLIRIPRWCSAPFMVQKALNGIMFFYQI